MKHLYSQIGATLILMAGGSLLVADDGSVGATPQTSAYQKQPESTGTSETVFVSDQGRTIKKSPARSLKSTILLASEQPPEAPQRPADPVSERLGSSGSSRRSLQLRSGGRSRGLRPM